MSTSAPPRATLGPGGMVTDWGKLERARVAHRARPRNEEELRETLATAADRGLPVSLRGCAHSAGAQSFCEGGVTIDVREMREVLELDEEARTIRVQAGATWGDLTPGLERLRLSPLTKQEFETFTIGGSIAANAHGKSIDHGPIIAGVRSLRILKADGEIATASREENLELFMAAVGGYGLLGVIVDATLELVADRAVTNTERVFDDAPALIASYVERTKPEHRERTPLCYGFLDGECRRGFYVAYTHLEEADRRELSELRRHEPPPVLFNALVALQRRSALIRRATLRGMWASTRMSEVTLRSRRLLLWDEPPAALERTLLQKFLVPVDRFAALVERAGAVLARFGKRLPQFPPHFRLVPGDDEALLPLAPEDSICLILCHLAEPGDARWRRSFEQATSELLEIALDLGGRHYLTFDAVASREQLLRAYPRWEEFAALKRRHDPGTLFTSGFYQHYEEAQ